MAGPPPTRPPPAPPPPKRTDSVSSALPQAVELHALLRRFNQQVHHLKRDPVLSHNIDQLDFCSAPPSKFRPEILRCNLERCYLLVVKAAISAVGEVNRLRSWEDPLRTGSWALGYFVAWSSPVGVGAVAVIGVAGLVVSPGLRAAAFPPHSRAAPVVPVPNSVAPDGKADLSHPDEAEQAAQAFAEDVASLAQVAATPGPELAPPQTGRAADPLGHSSDEDSLGPIEAALETDIEAEQKRKKVDRLARIGLPLQALSGDLADGAERWQAALSPRAPFPPCEARAKLGAILALVAVALAVVPPALLQKVVMAVLGAAFFGGPAIERGLRLLDQAKPRWREALELRNSLLKGVPANVQYVATLLRLGEQAGRPVRPPPPRATPPVSRAPSGPVPVKPAAASKGSPGAGDMPAPTEKEPAVAVAAKHPKKSKFKLADLVKGAAAMTEHAAGVAAGHRSIDWEGMSRVVVDEMKRRTGSNLPEIFMAAVPATGASSKENNFTFFGHYRGRPGHLILKPPGTGEKGDAFAGSWRLEFVSIWATKKKSTVGLSGSGSGPPPLPARRPSGVSVLSVDATTDEPAAMEPAAPTDAKKPKADKATLKVSFPVDGLISLRKTTGLGWKSRLAAGWAVGVDSLGDGIVADWVEDPALLQGAEAEVERGLAEAAFGGIVRRDELFNRLVGLSKGRFVCC